MMGHLPRAVISGSHAPRGNPLAPTLRVGSSDAERRKQGVPTRSVGTRGVPRTIILAVILWCSNALAAGPPATERQPAVEATSPEPARYDLGAYHARTRAAINEVLAQREFADLRSDPYAGWRRLRDWILSTLEGVASGLRRLPEWVLWAIVTWMVLILAAILAHMIYTLVKLLRGTAWRPLAGSPSRRHAGELLGIRDLDFDTVYAEARRLLAAGDWLAATKYLYVAAILGLDRQGRVAFRLSKTNRDYVEELRAEGPLQGLFRRLTGRFEPIVYGGQAATTLTSHDMANTVEGLLNGPAGVIAN